MGQLTSVHPDCRQNVNSSDTPSPSHVPVTLSGERLDRGIVEEAETTVKAWKIIGRGVMLALHTEYSFGTRSKK